MPPPGVAGAREAAARTGKDSTILTVDSDVGRHRWPPYGERAASPGANLKCFPKQVSVAAAALPVLQTRRPVPPRCFPCPRQCLRMRLVCLASCASVRPCAPAPSIPTAWTQVTAHRTQTARPCKMTQHCEVRAASSGKEVPHLLKTLRQYVGTTLTVGREVPPHLQELAANLRRHGLMAVRGGKRQRYPVAAFAWAPLHTGPDLAAAVRGALKDVEGFQGVSFHTHDGSAREAGHYIGSGTTRGGTRDHELLAKRSSCFLPWKSYAELQTTGTHGSGSRLQVYARRSELAAPWLTAVQAQRGNGVTTSFPHAAHNLRVDFRPGDPSLVEAGSGAAWDHCVVDHKQARVLPVTETRVILQGRHRPANVKRGAPGSPSDPPQQRPCVVKPTYGEIPFECLPVGHVLRHPCVSAALHTYSFRRQELFSANGQALLDFARSRGWTGQSLQFPDHAAARAAVYWVHRGRCNACNTVLSEEGPTAGEVDHIVPYRDALPAPGGLAGMAPLVAHLWNLQLLCRDCHHTKTHVIDQDTVTGAEDQPLRELRQPRRTGHAWVAAPEAVRSTPAPVRAETWAGRMDTAVGLALLQLDDANGPAPSDAVDRSAHVSGRFSTIREGCRSVWGLRASGAGFRLRPLSVGPENEQRSWQTGPFWHLWQTVSHSDAQPPSPTAALHRRHTTAMWETRGLRCEKDAAGVRICPKSDAGGGGGAFLDDVITFLGTLAAEVVAPGPKAPWLLPGEHPGRLQVALDQIDRPRPDRPDSPPTSIHVDLGSAPVRSTLSFTASSGWVRRSFWLAHEATEVVAPEQVRARRAQGVLTLQPLAGPSVESASNFSEWPGPGPHVDRWVRGRADLA